MSYHRTESVHFFVLMNPATKMRLERLGWFNSLSGGAMSLVFAWNSWLNTEVGRAIGEIVEMGFCARGL